MMIGIMLRAAMSAEGGSRWVRRITNPNGKFLFVFLFVRGRSSSGSGCSSCPTRGRTRRTAAIGLIALFSGFFIMMGFLWAVIGE